MKKKLLMFTMIALLFSACNQNDPEVNTHEKEVKEFIGEYSLSLVLGQKEFYMYDDNTHKLLITADPPVSAYSNKELKIWATDENDKKNGITNELFIAGGEIMSLADVKSNKLYIRSNGDEYYTGGTLYTFSFNHEPAKLINNIMEWKCIFQLHAVYGSNSATGEYKFTYKAVKK